MSGPGTPDSAQAEAIVKQLLAQKFSPEMIAAEFKRQGIPLPPSLGGQPKPAPAAPAPAPAASGVPGPMDILKFGAGQALNSLVPGSTAAIKASGVGDLTAKDIPGMAANAAQGAFLNAPGAMFPRLKALADSFAQQKPMQAAGARFNGGLATGAGLAKLVTIPPALLPLVGAGEGAAAGYMGAQPGQEGRDAAVGGAVGLGVGLIPGAANLVGKVWKAVVNRFAPESDMAMQLARNLYKVPVNTSEGAATISPEAALARAHALAPKAALVGSLGPEISKATAGISADPQAAKQAYDATEEAMQAIQQAQQKLQAEYAATGDHPAYSDIGVSPRLKSILVRGGEPPSVYSSDRLRFEEMQSIRQDIGARLGKAAAQGDPNDVRILSKAYQDMQDFMADHYQGDPKAGLRPLKAIDGDWGFTKALEDRTQTFQDAIKSGTQSQSRQAVAGQQAVSAAGQVTRSGMSPVGMLDKLAPGAGPAERAAIISKMAATPTGGTMPQPMATAQRMLNAPPVPAPSAAPAVQGAAGATSSFMDMLKRRALFGS